MEVGLAFAGVLALAACGEAGPVAPPPGAVTTATAVASGTATPSPDLGAVVIQPGQDVRIGVSTSLSGATAVLGEDIRDAVVLAIEDFGGSLKGFPVTVTAADDGCTNAAKAVAAANRLIADPLVVAVVGPMCSNGAQAANPIFERAGLLHVSASASMPSLTEEGSRFFFRTAWRDDRQGAALAAYALETLGAHKAVAIDDGGRYGEGVAAEFAGLFQARGGVLAAREKVAPGQTDFSGLVGRILEAAPEAVLFAGFGAEAAPFVQQLRAAGYLGAFLGPDSLFDAQLFLAAALPAAEGAVVLSAPPLPEAMAAAFRQRFGREPRSPFMSHAYDATTVLLNVVESVAVEEGGKLVVDRAALIKGLRSQALMGLTGRIRFDEAGDRSGLRAEQMGLSFYVVKDGRLVLTGGPGATPTPTPSAVATPTP